MEISADTRSTAGLILLTALLVECPCRSPSRGPDRTEANRWIVLVYLGAVVLALSVATLGIALLVSS